MYFFFVALLMLLIAVMISFNLPVAYGLINQLQVTAYLLIPLLAILLVIPILRKRLPGIEMRANQAVVAVIYVVCAVIYILVGHALVNLMPDAWRMASLTALVILGFVFAPSFYLKLRKEIHSRFLGIQLQSYELVQATTHSIVTSLDLEHLGDLLENKLLPALMIREAALVRMDDLCSPSPLLLQGVGEAQLPAAEELKELLSSAGRYRPIPDEGQPLVCPWVRLALPLTIEDRTIGVCLLGRRDPDDFYSVEELPALRAIVNQVALALSNIEQTEMLRAFHYSNVQRHEQQQSTLARDLHDDVLNQMALLSVSHRDVQLPESFSAGYQNVIDHIRGLVNGLRPPVIAYGLRFSLNVLVDTLADEAPHATVDWQHTGEEPAPTPELEEVEIQFYRIAQEACRNALRHAPNCHLTLTIHQDPGKIEMTIADDGPGFECGEALDFTTLLANRHFGLATMYERAKIIDARLNIRSAPGQGTTVHVLWKS